MFNDPCRVDQELSPDPRAYPMLSAYPCRQRCQAATERGRIAIGSFDRASPSPQPLTKTGLHQRDALQAVRTLIMVASTRIFPTRQRRDQLIALLVRPVEQVIGVVIAVGQQVTTAGQLRDQAAGN